MKHLFAIAVVVIASSAHADNFVCHGTGRFSSISEKPISLVWKTNEYQKVILENETTKVQVNVDKSNTDGTHYLAIEVLETDRQTRTITFKGAKGSLKDMVMYVDSVTSLINCLPLPIAK